MLIAQVTLLLNQLSLNGEKVTDFNNQKLLLLLFFYNFTLFRQVVSLREAVELLGEVLLQNINFF